MWRLKTSVDAPSQRCADFAFIGASPGRRTAATVAVPDAVAIVE